MRQKYILEIDLGNISEEEAKAILKIFQKSCARNGAKIKLVGKSNNEA